MDPEGRRNRPGAGGSVNIAVGIFVIAASAVGIVAGVVALVRFLTGLQDKFEASVEKIVAPKLDDLAAKLTKEFSGNGGGAREAINELHVKVDDGFARAHKERDELLDRVNALEKERVIRDDPPNNG